MRRNESQQPNLSTIYVGLIPFDWSEDNFKAVVCGLGNVYDVRLGFDHIGKNKGFAFVEFETPQQAVNAAQLLTKVQIVMPSLGQVRRLRTEVKETFRSNDQRAIIPLKPEHLPAGVQFPPEVVVKKPQLLWASQAKYASFSGPDIPSNTPNSRGASHTPPLPGNMGNMGSIAPPNSSNTLPGELLKATHYLALPKKLPFSTPDKINETLGQISPPQLIELIANLKNIMNSSDSARAAEVFRLSPNLAASATQALLLMGFIDEEVIQEAMKAEIGNATPAAPITPQQQNIHPGPSHQNLPLLPPAPTGPSTPSRWPNLSLLAQMKLSALPSDQAELIAQVLALSPEQISALPSDRQSMVAGIRQQYA
ncbi:hypothetical protein METBIDRAFT_37337 [Metschnikowia bicuspidata var. bicuspidata NRRL YB-4993]|uniref:RRM domain-containing protein n=1 Tax=Metschnikowia bicuspidata var. bicuspidata NRRL YB-4993 TaxID=869754 RepID=A0A1A0HFT3_9ASCO|nr:hypothetical protein METBIDRAFT_37337 [Metschnikowia bicuspidata var. bicuspidata NRRL YB-4993]OBA22861.1 hypothetical protein METBIDRAFT_37337 [Metschnikowia bicuspidata var. bicuspidata NRRL YB-4993]